MFSDVVGIVDAAVLKEREECAAQLEAEAKYLRGLWPNVGRIPLNCHLTILTYEAAACSIRSRTKHVD
jgi:hypothetical protein